MASLWGLIVMPLYQVGKFFYVPGRLEKVKKPRMFASLAAVIAILAAVVFVPLPHTVMAILEIQPHGADPVYVNVAEGGRLAERDVKAGQAVVKGQRLAVLENNDLDMEIAKLVAKEKEYEVKLDNLRGMLNHSDRQVGRHHPAIGEGPGRRSASSGRKKRPTAIGLVLKAARDGTVLPPPPTPAPHQEEMEGGQLPSWSGTPLDEENYRPYLKEGVLFCQVGDPRNLEAILVIDQGDIDFVKDGPGGRSEVRRPAPRHAARHDRAGLARQLEDHSPAAIDQGQGRVGQHDRSGHRRGDAAERILPGRRAARRQGRRDARRPPRPGQDPHRPALARRPALAADHEHLQLPAIDEMQAGVAIRGIAGPQPPN